MRAPIMEVCPGAPTDEATALRFEGIALIYKYITGKPDGSDTAEKRDSLPHVSVFVINIDALLCIREYLHSMLFHVQPNKQVVDLQ